MFYGWTIVGVATFAMFAATLTGGAGFSVFIQPMAADLGWSRTVLAGALSAGTVVGALVAPLVGRAIDRYGARLALTLCGLGIAATLAAVSGVQTQLAFLAAYGFARAIDMGALNLAVTTAVSNWFVRRRGRALGIAMTGNAIGVMLLVPVAQWLIDGPGWRTAWLVLGAGSGLVLAILAALFLRRRPEEMGLLPDGKLPQGGLPLPLGDDVSLATTPDSQAPLARGWYKCAARNKCASLGEGFSRDRQQRQPPVSQSHPLSRSEARGTSPPGRPSQPPSDPLATRSPGEPSYTARQAARSRAFWLLMLASSAGRLAVSGLTTHQVALLVENGISPAAAAGTVSLYGLGWVAGSLAWGFVIERLSARRALALASLLVALCCLAALGIREPLLLVPYALVYGVSNGAKEALDAVVWADYFGRRAVGAIRGLSRPVVVGAGALGAFTGGLGYDLAGSYTPIMLVFAMIALGGAAASLLARPPCPIDPGRSP